MIAWITLTFPLWVFRAPNHNGGTREAWLRAMYAAVTMSLLAMLLVKEVNPAVRIPTSPFLIAPIVCGIMIGIFRYLQSVWGVTALSVYSKLSHKTKIIMGTGWMAAYMALFMRIAELAPR